MSSKQKLAIHGGPKTKTTPYGTGMRFSEVELAYLKEALAQNTLFYGAGTLVKRACAGMQAYTGLPPCRGLQQRQCGGPPGLDRLRHRAGR